MKPLRDIYDQVNRINQDGEGTEDYVWNVPSVVDNRGRIRKLILSVNRFDAVLEMVGGVLYATSDYKGLPPASTLRFLEEVDRRTEGALAKAFQGSRPDIADELEALRQVSEDGPLTIQPTTFLTWEEDIFPPSQHRRT